jgi:hypothetical protein
VVIFQAMKRVRAHPEAHAGRSERIGDATRLARPEALACEPGSWANVYFPAGRRLFALFHVK